MYTTTKDKFKAYYPRYYTVATIQSTTSLLKDISMTILLKHSIAEPTERIFRKKCYAPYKSKKNTKTWFSFFFAKNLDEERNLHYFCYLTPNFQTLDFIKLGLIFVDSYTNELKYKHKSILLRHFF